VSSETPHLDKARAYVIDQVTPLVPDDWDIKPGIATPTTISKTTVFVEYTEIEPLPEAPIGSARCVLELTVTSPLTDLAKGENDVDADVLELVLALDRHKKIAWRRATKRAIVEAYLGWTIAVTLIAETTPTPPPEPEEP
jgi:hypothetical protein